MHNENELVPGLVLPAPFQDAFRKRLIEVKTADSEVNCLIAQARLEGLVEALETVTHGITAIHIERLYLLVDGAAASRLAAL